MVGKPIKTSFQRRKQARTGLWLGDLAELSPEKQMLLLLRTKKNVCTNQKLGMSINVKHVWGSWQKIGRRARAHARNKIS